MRLHWFTPWPPARDEAARRARDLARALAREGHAIVLIVADAAAGPSEPPPPGVTLLRIGDYEAGLAGSPADLAVYQIVGSPAGAFLWPQLALRPGLAILQDAALFSARAAEAPARAALFRSEFAFNEPHSSPDAAELAIAGWRGSYERLWPMLRVVVERSLAVAAPTAADARDLQARWPDRPTVGIRAGIAQPAIDPAAVRAAARAEFGLSEDLVVFGVSLGAHDRPEMRRLPQILRALAATLARAPAARLLVAGDPIIDPPAACGERVRQIEAVTDASRARLMAAIDVLIDLRWPRTGGPSDDWLAAMAAGRPAMVMDSEAFSDWPLIDPRSWRPLAAAPPIGVAIDVLDEDHSLRAALYRLTIDRHLGARLGDAARAFWATSHTLERMAADVSRAMDLARAASPPRLDLPPDIGQALAGGHQARPVRQAAD